MPMPPAPGQGTLPMPTAPARAPGQPAGPIVGDAPAPAPQTAAQQPSAAAPVANTPMTAADSSIIEGEWIAKAQQIVAATANDPFEQNRQLAALKADYMQKRYGKSVKLN